MTKLKLLHLRAGGFYGGPERQLHLGAMHLKESGYEPFVASFNDGGSKPEFLDVMARDGIATHCFDTSSAYDFKVIDSLRRYLVENSIDYLCTHEYRSHFIGMRARRGTKADWIAYSRGWTKENLKTRFFHTLDKVIIRFADRIVAVSEAQASKLRDLMIPSHKICVIHNAVDVSRFASIKPADLKKRFDFPEDSVIGIAAGRFSREKGQDFLIDTALQLLDDLPQLRLVLFGTGPDFDTINERIRRHGVSDRIVCPGFDPNIISCIKGADFLVNPSESEGLPNIVMEAMAVDIPVVATAVGGVPELLRDRHSGLLVRYGDTIAMRGAITALCDDPQLRKNLAREAQETLTSTFTFEHQAEQLTSLLKEIRS